VLTAVDFDNETVSDRHEIRDIRSNRPLATKFVPDRTPIAQRHPQLALCVGLASA
jgi:hypothetical protein